MRPSQAGSFVLSRPRGVNVFHIYCTLVRVRAKAPASKPPRMWGIDPRRGLEARRRLGPHALYGRDRLAAVTPFFYQPLSGRVSHWVALERGGD